MEFLFLCRIEVQPTQPTNPTLMNIVLKILPKTKYQNNLNLTFMVLTFGYNLINVGFVGNVGDTTHRKIYELSK